MQRILHLSVCRAKWLQCICALTASLVGLPDKRCDAQLTMNNFLMYKYVPCHIWNILTLNNYLLFTWSLDLTDLLLFLFANLSSPTPCGLGSACHWATWTLVSILYIYRGNGEPWRTMALRESIAGTMWRKRFIIFKSLLSIMGHRILTWHFGSTRLPQGRKVMRIWTPISRFKLLFLLSS